MESYRKLQISGNESEGFQVSGNRIAVHITTAEMSDVELQRSIKNTDFKTIPDSSVQLNGSDEFNFVDFVAGQFVRVVATSGTLLNVEILG